MPASQIRTCQTHIETEKNIWKIIAIKEKKLLNYLVNCAEKCRK